MALQKNDFVELEFTAKTSDGELFDSNRLADAKIINPNIKEIKPLFVAVGQEMVIKGLDKSLPSKEVGKNYIEEFQPEEAFGKRNPSLVKMVPLKVFLEQKIRPEKGMQLNMDGMIAKVISISGGRVLMDFNNPLAGKKVIYDFKVKRKIEDVNEKINGLQDFFIGRRFLFEVKDKKVIFKLTVKEKQIENFIKLFDKQFKEVLGLETAFESIPEKESKKEEKKA